MISLFKKKPIELRLLPKGDPILRFAPDKTVREAIGSQSYVKSEEISQSLRAVVDLVAGSALTGSYRMIVPPGAIGTVMSYNAHPHLMGALSATMAGPGGNFTNPVGYVPQAALGAAFMVYSIAAFLTGQYFYVTITKRLVKIQEGLDEIRRGIIGINDSSFDASLQYLDNGLRNSKDILACEPLRLAYLANTQRLSIENRAYHIFNMKEFRAEMSKLRETDRATRGDAWEQLREVGERGRPKVLDLSRKAALSLSMHAYFAALECELSGITSTKILRSEFAQVETLCEEADREFAAASDFWHSVSQREQWSRCKEVSREDLVAARTENESLRAQVKEARSNFSTLVERLTQIHEKPCEILWLDGHAYIQAQLA